MYQLSMSVGTEYASWFYTIEKKLKDSLDGNALLVTRDESTRLYIAVACETQAKKKVSAAICDALLDIYSGPAKRHYFKENLHLPLLPPEKYNVLLAALVEFDSLSDRALIKDTFSLESGLNIDGVYNFAFREIKSRWKDIGELTRENAAYLSDNDIFFELIKYLFSAITPKTEKILCAYDGENYLLYDSNAGKEPVVSVQTEDELLCELIRIAPVCLEIAGQVDKTVFKKLNSIFRER